VIFLVALVAALVETIRVGGLGWLVVLAGLVVGGLLGLLATRMNRLEWDGFAQKVVGKIDALGLVILVLYVVFSVFRSRLVHLWVHGPISGATSLAVLAGLMLGQVYGIRFGLRRLAQELGVHRRR
jgi:hypothetical protein